ncbi:MAG: Hsp20/alpha crystallin family protein [Bacteroidota bacterium]
MVLLKSKPGLIMNDAFIPSSFHSLINDFLNEGKTSATATGFTPHADIIEKQSHFEIQMALPGLKKEDVKIHVEGDQLTVSGEKQTTALAENEKVHKREIHFGKFSRTFNLGKVNKTKVEAKFENGVLTLTLPKLEEEQPLTIDIK